MHNWPKLANIMEAWSNMEQRLLSSASIDRSWPDLGSRSNFWRTVATTSKFAGFAGDDFRVPRLSLQQLVWLNTPSASNRRLKVGSNSADMVESKQQLAHAGPKSAAVAPIRSSSGRGLGPSSAGHRPNLLDSDKKWPSVGQGWPKPARVSRLRADSAGIGHNSVEFAHCWLNSASKSPKSGQPRVHLDRNRECRRNRAELGKIRSKLKTSSPKAPESWIRQ